MTISDQEISRLPTQSIKPWTAGVRTAIIATLAFIPLAQSAAIELGINEIPWIAGTLGFMLAIQRVISMPGVELFLQKYVPMLAAAGAYVGRHRGDKNNGYTPTPTNDGSK